MKIFTIAKKYSVFIQTDKPMYKPNDTVQYRIFVLDSELKPYLLIRKIRIEMFDGKGNIFKSIEKPETASEKDVTTQSSVPEDEDEKADSEEEKPFNTATEKMETTTRANKPRDKNIFRNNVFKDSFQIDVEPVLGIWGIRVKVNEDEEETTHKFEVKEYVLPRFEVFVGGKSHVTENEGVIRLVISANYTFGQFVKGQAEIKAEMFDSAILDKVQATFTKTVDIEQQQAVSFNIRNELQIPNTIRPIIANFTVTFREHSTRETQRSYKTVRVHHYDDFKLELFRDQKTFKPGYPYSIRAIVRKNDDSLVLDQGKSVELNLKFFLTHLKCTSKNDTNLANRLIETNKMATPKEGFATFDFIVPANATAISITASYLSAKASMNVTRFDSRTREYLFASFRNK